MELSCTQYNEQINIYYQDEFSHEELAETIIQAAWLNPGLLESQKEIQLVYNFHREAPVYKIDFNNRIYYFKIYSYRTFNKTLRNLFRPPEGIRFFQTAIQLMRGNIEIAKPVLSLTYRRNLFITDSIFVLEELPGVGLDTYLVSNGNSAKRAEVVQQIAWIWSKLIDHRFVHLDPASENFLVNDEGGNLRVGLTDLDSIRAVPAVHPLKYLLIRQMVRFKRRFFRLLSEEEIALLFEELVGNCATAIKFETLWRIYKTPSNRTFRHIL